MHRSLSSADRAEYQKVVHECDTKLHELNARRVDYEIILEETKEKIAKEEVKKNRALKHLGFDDSSSSEAVKQAPDSSSSEAVNKALDSYSDGGSAGTGHLVGTGYKFITEITSVDLMPTIGMLESRPRLSEISSVFSETGHRVKIRNIEFLVTNPDHFFTSGDDGYIHKWEMISDAHAEKIFTFDATHNGSFPEDVAVNPADGSVVAGYRHQEKLKVYSLFSGQEVGDSVRGTEIDETPHQKGISQVTFMPWNNNGNPVFMSSGSLKHEIVAWGMFDSLWQTTAFYKAHTDSVTGLSGHFERFHAISVGRDKRIVVFDLEKEKVVLREKIDAKCVGVAANPIDSNLFCVQTSVDGEQLRLLDLRYQDGEVAAFGWKKPNDLQNSALVAPTWSPSGLLLTAGSGGREVKIFDIRYHVGKKPLSCERSDHQGKVYKVAWAPTRNVLISTGGTRIRLHRLRGDILP